MAYDRVNWENTPSRVTPISAENLNIMDEAIDTLDEEVSRLGTKATNLETRMGAAEEDIDEIGGELTEQDTYAKGVGTRSLQNETDIAVLQGQVAQIISGGSPAGDEVTDIRVAENGTTYNSAGDAVRAQVRQLVTVSDTEPDTPGNKIWIDESGYSEETQVPTWEEFSDLKQDYNKIADVLDYPINKRIPNTSVSASGVVYTDDDWDTYAQEIVPSTTIAISVTSGAFVYAFFANEPAIDSVSYNSSRTYSGSATASGISVPSGVSWILVRVPKGTSATITPTSSAVLDKLKSSTDAFDDYIELQGKQITANNYASQLPDANNADNEATYVLTFLAGSTSIPANLPVSSLTETNSFLTSIGEGSASKVQFFAMGKGVWYRFKVSPSIWSDWVEVSRHRTFHVGTGQPYTTIRSAVAEAIKHNGTVVYVHSGTYDLLDEFADIIADFPEDGYQGIKLENDVKLIFSPDADVTFLYTGSDTNVLRYFSPFFSGVNGGYTIDGLHLKASNCRYCIHEDAKGVSSNTPYLRNVTIKNCDLYIDNSANTNYPQCIGGGLTDNCTVHLFDNVMESERANSGIYPVASWHGCASGGISNIVASGNYCVGKGTLRFNHYGIATADEATKCLVNNNSVGSAIINNYENESAYPNANMKLIDWNNVIRQ